MERKQQLTPQAEYNTKKRFLLKVVPPLGSTAFKLLSGSCSLEVRGFEHLEKLRADHGQIVVAFWHEVVGLAAWYHRNVGYYTITSQSFDGELAARMVMRMGFKVVRGSSTRGGAVAMSQLQEALAGSPGFGFTIDGPRGPRRVAKPGIAYLSQRTGIPVLPNAFWVDRAWRLRSWDRLVIPKPMGRIICSFGPPVPPPTERSREAIEDTRQRIERAVNALHAELESPEIPG